MLRSSLLVLALASALAPSVARAQRTVYVGVFLRDVSRFEQREGVFDADFDLWAKWRGDLDRDAIRIANAARVEQDFLGEETDGPWHAARWRVRGTLRGEFPLHRFPFDQQELPIVLELADMHGRLVPDLASSSMAERFSVTDWNYEPTFHPAVSERVLPSDLGHLAHEGQPTTLHRVVYRVRLQRPFTPVVIKLFVPLFIIILVALASLFMHPTHVPARSGMAVTSLLSCFAFQFTVADSLPAVTYVTLADTLFLIGYVMSGITVGVTIVTTQLHRIGREGAAAWVDRVLRVLLPLGGIFAVWSAIPPDIEPDVIEAEPIPEMARHESHRDVLRIGTNLLSSVSGSPGGFAAGWGLLHEDPIDGQQVVLVERAPGVANRSLQLLAGGGVRVTWTLRDGLRWSDGEPFTTRDLAFSEEIAPDPEIASAETPDERTFVVTWNRALARALDAPSADAAHDARETFDEGGYEALRERWRGQVFPTLGPYRLAEWEAGVRLVLERNEHFVGAPACIPRVELLHFERDELVDAFNRGDIDMTVPNAITPEQAEAMRASSPEAVRLRPSSLFIFAELDLGVAAFQRVEVRRALLAAIDREALVQAVYGEYGRVAHIPVPGELPAEVVPLAHDVDAARAILEPLALSLPLHVTENAIDRQIAELLTEQLGAAGVTIETRFVPSTLRVSRAGEHGGIVLRITRGRRENDPRYWFGLRRVEGHYAPDARTAAYTDELQAMVEREERSLYPERREQLRDALFAEYASRLPSLPLMFAAERILVRPELRGWDMPPDIPFGRGLERWWFAR